MAKVSKTVQQACRLLRKRIHLREAGIRMKLPGEQFEEDRTDEIHAALEIYVTTWIDPILDAIEEGNTNKLQWSIRRQRGEKIGTPYNPRTPTPPTP